MVLHCEVCHSIVVNYAVVTVTEVPDPFSDHEVADTQLLLHTHQAAQVFSNVTIKSPDTNVKVISLAESHDFQGCLLLLMTGFGRENRIIYITELGIKKGQEKYQSILRLHILKDVTAYVRLREREDETLWANAGI